MEAGGGAVGEHGGGAESEDGGVGNGDLHEVAVTLLVEEAGAVARPAGAGAAVGGDLPLAVGAGKAGDVDFEVAGFVGS